MNYIYEIVKVVGIGVKESMEIEYSTGLLYYDKVEAEQEADKMWKTQTTKEDRESGWCALHFIVKKRNIN